jgi:MFS transporter, ACS family, hexuronate transporter
VQTKTNEIVPRPTNYRWVIIALAFAITLVNYLDRSAISYAIGPLRAEFGINEAQFGIIAGAFGIGYMIMTVGGGILVDAFGARRIWSGAALVWSLCTICMGVASSFEGLFFLRTALGIAEGPHFPSLTRVVADWLPIEERARATALGLTAVPFASVIGAPLISSLILGFGWKLMFAILGTLGIGWSFIWYALYRDSPKDSIYVSTEELNHIGHPSTAHSHKGEAKSTTWRFMLLNPSLLANNLAFFAFGYLLFFALTWLPGYFEHAYGLQLKQMRWYLIAPWLTAAILLPLAGFLSDWLYKKTGSMRVARSRLIWICQLISVACFVPLLFTHSLTITLIFISLGLGIGLMPNAAFYALNCDLAHDKAATSLGIMDCYFAAAGILAPILTGCVAQYTGNFQGAFALLIGFGLIAVVAVLFFQKPDQEL